MKIRHILLAMLLSAFACGCGSPYCNPLESTDPTVGGVGVLLQPTRPTVHLPHQLVRWTPGRIDLLDDRISDFPLTLTSHRLESVFGFLPFTENGTPWQERMQEYDNESVKPWLYSSELEDCSIRFTPSRKSGIIEVDFGQSEGLLRFRALNADGSFSLEGGALHGRENFHGMSAYAEISFSKAVQAVETSAGGSSVLLSCGPGKITIRYGLSYIDNAQAAANLESEIPSHDFEKTLSQARELWSRTLGQIRIKGGTPAQQRLFYTSLYRCCERMVDITEQGRYYSAFDHEIHESSRTFYTDNWMWDTHISLEPLHTILDPGREEDMLESYVEMYRQCGNMPSFAVIWGDWPAMTGNYAAVWMADSWAKGLRFDLETAYEGIREASLNSTLLPWRNGPKCELDDFYNENGWYPALHPGEAETVDAVSLPWERRQAVSLSTAYSYADWAAAKLARELGKTEDEALFMERAAFYRNVYRADKGMFWPKDKDGQWIEGVDPRYMDRAYFTENNAYTFQWDVKHDLQGLFSLMGGREQAEKKLDDLFRIQLSVPKFQFFTYLPDATGMVGQFAMGNEPGFHIPYIYDYLGSPWKTQKRIHQLIGMLFSDTVSGIPGDEDGGGMSSFVVFSMMGFFPVTPGIPVYAIGSPFFEECSIRLPSGRHFTVKAKGASERNKYICGATLNGKVLDRAGFTHEELMAGGVLELRMTSKPDRQWGRENLPPSSLSE